MPCGKESSPRIAIGRKLLTEEPPCVVQMAQLVIRPHSSSPNETATTGTVETTNRGRDRAMAQPQRLARLLEAQAASARVARGLLPQQFPADGERRGR